MSLSPASVPKAFPCGEPGQRPFQVGQHVLEGFGPLLLRVELHPARDTGGGVVGVSRLVWRVEKKVGGSRGGGGLELLWS